MREVRPPVALIAGGRPSQAAPLEAEGITTFLHVPSPGLLDRFLEGRRPALRLRGPRVRRPRRPALELRPVGARRSTGSSQASDLTEVDVLFAGGIHDARSAAMVAAMAAPLAARGAAIGVLMGTAYLFTEEAVARRRDQPGLPGRGRRVRATPCCSRPRPATPPAASTASTSRAFERRKAGWWRRAPTREAMWAELEELNLGRLRIARKGLRRDGDGW